MKKCLLLFFILTYFNSYSQHALDGTWVLEKTTYSNGKMLEVDHPDFSTFVEYIISGEKITTNGKEWDVSIDSTTISTRFLKLNYVLIDKYLVVREKNQNTIRFFLKTDDFLHKYPEFYDYKVLSGDTILTANEVLKPVFNHELSLDDFLHKNISAYSVYSSTNIRFYAEFILTKDNQIRDVRVISSISKRFDKQFSEALMLAQPFFKNDLGKDIVLSHEFNFFQMGNSGGNSLGRKIIDTHILMGTEFRANNYERVISQYDKLLELEDRPIRFRHSLNECYLQAGISFLALKRIDEACIAFNRVGDKKNFRVRHYLINYCK